MLSATFGFPKKGHICGCPFFIQHNNKKKTRIFFSSLFYYLYKLFKMAKSLRSATKKKTRGNLYSEGSDGIDWSMVLMFYFFVWLAIKRQNIFKPVEDARLARLAEAQAEAAKKPSVGDFMEDDKEVVADTEAMTEDEPKKKISTSGPRSGRHARKLKEKKKKGKKSSIKF